MDRGMNVHGILLSISHLLCTRVCHLKLGNQTKTKRKKRGESAHKYLKPMFHIENRQVPKAPHRLSSFK